ncbi:MAG: general secretion pathway protein GspH, partial [Calothrix sp. SM1_7_51]|nr:general secretion pathway protein GspH [Calothrix sp. SM1_7_51]
IELLVVVIIIGVLAAIALPSLLSQVSKARQTEARNNVGAINRGQQAYYLDNNNQFAGKISDLGLGLPDKTETFTTK